MLVSPGELELVRFTTMPCHVKVMLVSPGELELVRFTTMPCQGYASLTW